MKRIRIKRGILGLATIFAIGLGIPDAMAFNGIGNDLNDACEEAGFEPAEPYQDRNCLLCHRDAGSEGRRGKEGPGQEAWEDDNLEFFCQAPAPADTDGDGVIDDDDECVDEMGPASNNGCPLPPADTDGDGVIDDDDECVDEMGPASNNGCPLPPADTDGDGVIDDDDECVDEMGPASNNGCPLPPADTDGDGVIDDEDECVDEMGPASNNGCPLPPADTDGDGVIDDEDECVDEMGPASNNGCPLPPVPADTDGDGVFDDDDECVDEAGPVENNGCPLPPAPVDTDGDGVMDAVDECIDEAGPVENNGCPLPPAPVDTDGDGVMDAVDECIDEAGPAENNGCPLPPAPVDTDGDGVMDAVDECIDEAGPVENNGCPLAPAPVDTDGDGVMDDVDECIDEAGSVDNNGCPLPPTVDNSAPMLYLIPNATLTVGDELFIELNAKDADGDILSLTGSGLWDFDVQDNGDGTGSVVGTATTPGTHHGIVRVSDGMHNDFQMFKFTVLPVEPEDEPTHFFKATFQYNHTLKRLEGEMKSRPYDEKLRYDYGDRRCSKMYRKTFYTGSDENGNEVFAADPNCEGRSFVWVAIQPDKVPCSITLTARKVETKAFKVYGCNHEKYDDKHISAP